MGSEMCIRDRASVLTFALSSLSAFVGVLSLFPSRLPWPRNYSKLEALLVVHTARRRSQSGKLLVSNRKGNFPPFDLTLKPGFYAITPIA